MATLENLLKTINQVNRGVVSRIPTIRGLRRAKSPVDLDMVRLAYDFASEAHKDQIRKSGEPYITHPTAVAITVAKMGLDQDTIVAALLHDVPEDTEYSLVDVEKNFGPEVAKLVAGITKLGVIKYRGIDRYAENLRKMFISMAQDIRIILIKMADRLHNLTTLQHLPPEKQARIAQESLEIYAPIANRLGMGQIKTQIEELSFPYVYPEDYAWLKKEVAPKIELRMEYIQKVTAVLKHELSRQKIDVVDIQGRPKSLYSLYLKLIKPHYNRDITKIHDLAAIRIIVSTEGDCYKALGVIHQLWRPLPNRFKDYISQPKPNGYQSLHTTVFATDGMVTEIQIRTKKMHEQSEYGIAAHWLYKEKGRLIKKQVAPKTETKKPAWVDDLVKWQQEIIDHEQYLQSLTLDVFQNRIFVFTPKGDVIDLPEGATPVDFAYHVHSWIGDHYAGAKVNNQIASVETRLKNGDIVDVITDKNRKGPSRDWLEFVKTNAARSKIRAATNQRGQFEAN